MEKRRWHISAGYVVGIYNLLNVSAGTARGGEFRNHIRGQQLLKSFTQKLHFRAGIHGKWRGLRKEMWNMREHRHVIERFQHVRTVAKTPVYLQHSARQFVRTYQRDSYCKDFRETDTEESYENLSRKLKESNTLHEDVSTSH